MTPREARRAFGRQVVQLREIRKRNSNSIAGAAGLGAAFMKRVDRGESALPFVRALRVIRELDPEPAAAAGLLWLSILGCGLGAAERSYLLRILPVLAMRECEPLSGPSVLLRTEQLVELKRGLTSCLDRVEAVLTGATAQRSAAMASGELARKRLVPVNQLADLFPGDTRELRQTAMNKWLRELHVACVVSSGARRFVWFLVPLLCGRTVKSALRSLRSGKGRASAAISPKAFARFLELQLGSEGRSATSAWRILRVESKRHGWAWEVSASTMRGRMKAFFRDFPELRR